jgi:hypothetical protein
MDREGTRKCVSMKEKCMESSECQERETSAWTLDKDKTI